MDTTIRAQIMALADEKYRQFSASLIPNINNVVGVRLPELRKLARNIAKGDWRAYLAQADSDYFEEVMLQGMVIGCAKADVEEILHHIAAFVPKIDNWSVCDSFCSGLKITSLHKERVWEFIQPYLESDREYNIRFGVVMLLNYYIDELHIHRVLERLDRITHEGYYVKMAVAWAVSICFVKLPDITMDYVRSNSLDDFTYNKALQKITESYRVAPETKALIRSMKRK
ncbi:DNA alkylation repair protein [Paenibacillus thiaminolyticus]|uniref:DNA alkylation repair protein n=1 Tax=Paenibacillus thiaminolyticus TaxID=49283 RepID=A0AAP9DQK9_PANTH|nr:DNA alkylation repair protein [Paenibacillus thiaminolyticus]MCY9536942.1 DNA alkylation repair protein [Paenibacillus thiaminolyticus]MCY9603692.1 DNA alkylation repair protein [Paenibacillus thiaminolyticus]MCY9606696.1 DNA alkylation repair protein [Paenibacillus thiaminolyticus]MCY9612774.1 DNA alkylation repair protein [Paenibacillus thiaminolyticus]MCY9619736.1 DNA alkylation repair protein [Paenibacillus thiaminolyticus]